MANIRFKNLSSLLNDMEKKKWIIDSFFFPELQAETGNKRK